MFETDKDRQAHLKGEIPETLGSAVPDLTAADPDIVLVDSIAVQYRLTEARLLHPPLRRSRRPRFGVTAPTHMDVLG